MLKIKVANLKILLQIKKKNKKIKRIFVTDNNNTNFNYDTNIRVIVMKMIEILLKTMVAIMNKILWSQR